MCKIEKLRKKRAKILSEYKKQKEKIKREGQNEGNIQKIWHILYYACFIYQDTMIMMNRHCVYVINFIDYNNLINR